MPTGVEGVVITSFVEVAVVVLIATVVLTETDIFVLLVSFNEDM